MRRWLAQLIEENAIERLGRRRGAKYRIATPMSFQESSEQEYFRPESLRALQQIQRPLCYRRPVSYVTDWLDAYVPNQTFYLPFSLRSELHQVGKRTAPKDPAGTYARQILNRLLIDLSYNSSRLEGNTYSLLETERLILQGVGAEGKLDEEKIMILNHKEAIRYLVDHASSVRPTKETICTLHFLLADSLIERPYSGKVRDHGVRIGGSTYLPFEGSERLELLLEQIANKASLIQDPHEQSFFLLAHISYLQAFADVNKRTARLSANIPFITHNLVPLSFNDIEREDYISALIAIYELQEINPLLDLYAFSYQRTATLCDETAKAVGLDEIRARYRQPRRALLRHIILNHLTGAALESFISSQALAQIPEADRPAFIEDLRQDLEEINPIRIAGLGVSLGELKSWEKTHSRMRK